MTLEADVLGRVVLALDRLSIPYMVTGSIAVSPEDAVLSKLEWARMGGDSERQIRDAAGIVEVTTSLDREYLRFWARELGVLDLWERIAQGA